MNIALTGSSGVVGKFLARRFIERGSNLVTVHKNNKHESRPDFITYERLCDIKQDSFDLILHVGAAIPDSKKPNPSFDYMLSNLKSTIQIFNWAIKFKGAHFVYVSSTHLREFCDPSKKLSLPKSLADIEVNNYFESKHASEIFLKNFAEGLDNPFSIIRIGTPFSSDFCGSGLMNTLIANAQLGETTDIYSNMEEILNLTWLEDIVTAIDRVLDHRGKTEYVDLVSSSSTLGEIISALSKNLIDEIKIRDLSYKNTTRFDRRNHTETEQLLDMGLTTLQVSLEQFLKVGQQ